MIQKVEKLKEIINQNSMGHLPLAYRVDLMKQIGDTRTVQKVFMFSITSFKGDIITLNTRNTDKICNAFRNIRELMYNKNSKQGAWFQVEMFLKSKAQYTLKFNYDNLEQIPSFFQKPDWLLEMFREYPRSQEYTPLWLRKIVGRRKLYLT